MRTYNEPMLYQDLLRSALCNTKQQCHTEAWASGVLRNRGRCPSIKNGPATYVVAAGSRSSLPVALQRATRLLAEVLLDASLPRNIRRADTEDSAAAHGAAWFDLTLAVSVLAGRQDSVIQASFVQLACALYCEMCNLQCNAS